MEISVAKTSGITCAMETAMMGECVALWDIVAPLNITALIEG